MQRVQVRRRKSLVGIDRQPDFRVARPARRARARHRRASPISFSLIAARLRKFERTRGHRGRAVGANGVGAEQRPRLAPAPPAATPAGAPAGLPAPRARSRARCAPRRPAAAAGSRCASTPASIAARTASSCASIDGRCSRPGSPRRRPRRDPQPVALDSVTTTTSRLSIVWPVIRNGTRSGQRSVLMRSPRRLPRGPDSCGARKFLRAAARPRPPSPVRTGSQHGRPSACLELAQIAPRPLRRGRGEVLTLMPTTRAFGLVRRAALRWRRWPSRSLASGNWGIRRCARDQCGGTTRARRAAIRGSGRA